MAVKYLNHYEVRYYPASTYKGARLGIFKDGKRIKIVSRDYSIRPDEQAILEVANISNKEILGVVETKKGWIVVVVVDD